jgi:hypothetical protein
MPHHEPADVDPKLHSECLGGAPPAVLRASKNSCADVHHFFARLSVSCFPLLRGGRKGIPHTISILFPTSMSLKGEG